MAQMTWAHVFALLASVWLVIAAPAASQAVRKDVSELTDAEVDSLRRGFQVMISRNSAPRGSPDYRRSLLYWANAHAHYGDDCAGDLNPRGRGYEGVDAHTATQPDERVIWCKCEHGTNQFLTWHRMYLTYFEAVLQEAAQDPTLRLPYWNYARTRQLPEIFRQRQYVDEAGRTRPNPLYVRARQPNLAEGDPLDAQIVSNGRAFSQPSYQAFNAALEMAPHGSVHCAVGVLSCPSGLMGDVPTAGLDPIFYLHHANLDRLYECWLGPTPGSRLPSDPQILNKRYSFVGGDGAVVTRPVSEMLRLDQIGVAYSQPENCPVRTGRPSAFLDTAETATIQIGGGSRLNRGVTRVPLAIDSETQAALRSSQFLSEQVDQRLLVIANIQFDVPPQSLYKVYLVTPTNERAFAGVINFFAATRPHRNHEGEVADDGLDVSLDVTDTIRAISPGGELPSDTSLEFVPSIGVSGTTIEQAAANIPVNANVRYERVDLLVVR